MGQGSDGEGVLGPGYIMTVEPTELGDRVDVGHGREEIKDDLQVFGLEQLGG